MSAQKKILFIVGSINQTTQMHQIASHLTGYKCYFSQIFGTNPLIKLAVKSGLLDNTVLGGQFKINSEEYLKKNGLQNDYAASVFNNKYDLLVLCSDLLVPNSFRKVKTVWVQEGMTDPFTTWAKMVKRLKLPSYLAMNTALNGSSNIANIYCAASEGYKEQFAKYGTDESRIFVTGIPNFDNAQIYLKNDFPHHNYVLVATSDIRETLRSDDRKKFITDSVAIAAGRKLIFKLHPNENKKRAIEEIRKYAPEDALIYTEGNTNHMIANCEELITQYSTVVYIGLALGKKVHSYFDLEDLKNKMPIQNGGTSALNIANICQGFIEFNGNTNDFIHSFKMEQTEHA